MKERLKRAKEREKQKENVIVKERETVIARVIDRESDMKEK